MNKKFDSWIQKQNIITKHLIFFSVTFPFTTLITWIIRSMIYDQINYALKNNQFIIIDLAIWLMYYIYSRLDSIKEKTKKWYEWN